MDLFAPDPERKDYNFPDDIPEGLKPTKKVPDDAYTAYLNSQKETGRVRKAVTNVGALASPEDAAKAFNLEHETGVDPVQALDPEVRKLYEKTAKLAKIPVERLIGSRTAQWAAKDPLHTDLVGGNYQHLLDTEDAADGILASATPGERKAILEERARVSGHNAKTTALESFLAGNAESLANFTTKPLLGLASTAISKADEALSWVFGVKPGVPGDPLGTAANAFNAGEQQIKTGVSPVLVDKETGKTFDNPDIKAFGSTFLGKEVFNQQALNSVANIPGTLLGMAIATATGRVAGLDAAAAHKVVPFFLGTEAGLGSMEKARQFRAEQGKPADPLMDLTEGVINAAVTTLLFTMPGNEPAKTTLGAMGVAGARAAVLGPTLAATENAASYLHGEHKDLWEGAVRSTASFLPWELLGPFQRMSGLAVDSGLRKLSEHKYIEATNHITEGTPFETAAIKAQDLVKYFQSKNIGEDATHRFVESLGVSDADFRVALATGGDINVKMGDYLAKVAASEHREGIEPLVKVGGTHQTVGEITDHIAMTRELAAVTEALKNIPATDPQRDLLRDKIAEEFGAATKVFTPNQVLEVADAFAKVMTVQAPKVHKTPEQLFEQSKLTVMSGMQDALTKMQEPSTVLTQPVRSQLREARQQIQTLKEPTYEAWRKSLQETYGKDYSKRLAATSFMGQKGAAAQKLIFEKASQKERGGAPPTVRNDADHAALVDRMVSMAQAGESGRFWYDDSAKAFLKLANGNELEAYKLAVLSAIYSPQTSVADNGRRAILAYYDAMQNRAISSGGVYPKVKELAQRIVEAKTHEELDNIISGQKVDAFQQNLINLFAPEHKKSDVATIDLHMMRALGYDKEAVSTAQYQYASDVMREVADQLGWDTAKEAQAAIWVAQKMGTDAKGKGSTADQAGVHYGTAADKIAGTVNVEGMPGASVRNDLFPNIGSATHQQLMQYHTDKMKIVGDTLRAAGIMVSGENTGHGYWEGESNPVTAFRIPLPHIGSASEHQMAPAARAEVERAARLVLDLVGDQDAIGWAKPFEATTLGEANTAHYALDRELTHQEMLKLGQDFAAAGLPAFIDASDPKNIKVINYDWSSVVSGAATQKSGQAKAYHKTLDKLILEALPANMKADITRIFTESGLVERGDTNGNGQGSRVDAQGSSVSDAGHLARGRAEIAALNDRYRTEFGWGDGGSGAGLRSIPEFGPREAPAGALDAHGVHYNVQPDLGELRGDQRNGTRSQETGRLSGIDPQDAELGPLLLRKQFYISEGGELPAKEKLVAGTYPHETVLKGLLDINSPAADRFKENAKILADASAGPGAYVENQFEKLVMDAGYNGTISGRVVTVFGHEAIPTRPFSSTVDVTGPTGGVVRLNQNHVPEFKPVDVQTPEFKNWFGSSTAVDDAGQPKRYFHGTLDEFTDFKDVKGRGIFFSPAPEFTDFFSRGNDGRTIPVFLKAEKPFDYRDQAHLEALRKSLGLTEEEVKNWNADTGSEAALEYVRVADGEWDAIESEHFQNFLKKNGYDSFYVAENGVPDNLAVYDSSQIKSAVSNTGEFDPNSKNIMFQPAYHGSPYNFSQFTLDHIGKGEGAQAYGWGLYFAGDRSVAEWYRSRLANKDPGHMIIGGKAMDPDNPAHIAAVAMWYHYEANPSDKELRAARVSGAEDLEFQLAGLRIASADYGRTDDSDAEIKMFEAAIALLKSSEPIELPKENTGQLYKVEIPEDHTMLSWDLPLSDQPQAVKDALARHVKETGDYSFSVDEQETNATGKSFYRYMATVLGKDEAASKLLSSMGISGIKYADGNTRNKTDKKFNYVVFDASAIKTLETYYQPDTGKNDPRGYLEFPAKADGTPREFKLALLANENKSTVFHELGHFYLELLGDMQMDPAADPSVREDYNKILNWLGVNDRSEITQAMHEKFADAHLQYLLEGKAPTPELVTPFKKFSKWLSKIGQQLLGVDVNMTDEVRGVFDRLYASEKEIEAANLQVKGEMFTTPEQAGMTPEKFEAYKKATAAELDAAKERLTSVLMRELDREQRREYRDQYEKTWTMTNDEVLQRPEYEALKALSDGVMADGVTKVKLSRQALVERYGEDLPGKLARDGNFVYTTEGGMDADSAAMMLGFSSGDKLIEALTGLEPRKALVDRMAKQRMEETHPSLMGNPEALREEAIKQLNGTQRERVLTLELQALRKKESQLRPVVEQALSEQSAEAKAAAKDREALTQEQQRISTDKAMEDRAAAKEAEVMPKIQAFRLAASAYMNQQSPWTIRPDQFLNTQRSASREAYKLALKNDYEGAAKAKEQELLNHFLYLEAVHAKEEAEGFRDFVKRNDSATVRGNLGKAGGTYLSQFDKIRDRFGIERETNSQIANRESLGQWVESMTKDAKDPVIADWLLDELNTKNYRQLTMAEMRDVKNALTNIKHLAYAELGEIIEGKRVEYADMMEELETNFGKNTITRKPLLSASDRKRDALSFKTTAALEGFDATMVKLEAVMNWIDGDNVNGPAHRYMWDRIVKAQEHESRLTVELNGELLKALEAMPKDQRNKLHTETHDIGMDTPKTRGEILTMLLYSGHEVRKQKLLEGYASRGLTPEKLEKAFTKLNAADFEFAKTIWATFDKLAPEIRAMEERLTGVKPEWEKPQQFEVKGSDGQTVVLPGGYFPLVADHALTGELGKKQEGGTVQQVLTGNGYSRAATSTGHTKDLTGKTYPLLLDFQRTLTAELANQIHDLTHREAILSINKILHNDRFQELAKTHIGEAYEKQFNPWLVNIASDRNAGASSGVSAVNRLIEASRGNTVAAVLGFKYSSVVVQFADLLRVMAPGEYRVGAASLGKAFVELNPLNPKRAEIIKMIRELSPEMAHREDHIDRDIRSRLNDLTGRSDITAKWNRAAFSGLAMMDSIASWPTWLGRYREGMAKGLDSATAVKEADRSVRMLLMAGAPKDLVPVQANKQPLYRLITMFMGDATSNYNSMRNAGHNINGLKGIPTLTGAVLFVMLNNVFGDWLKGQGPDPDEDTAQWIARKAMLAPLGTAWGVRDIASTWDNILAGKPFHDYKFSAGLGAVQKALVDPVLHSKRLYDGTEEIADFALNTMESAGYLLGIGGTAQATASAKYFKRYQEGTEQPANAAEFVFDLTRGKKKEKN